MFDSQNEVHIVKLAIPSRLNQLKGNLVYTLCVHSGSTGQCKVCNVKFVQCNLHRKSASSIVNESATESGVKVANIAVWNSKPN